MDEKNCKICKKTSDLYLFKLEIEAVGGEYKTLELMVCDTCWDIIANIAKRAVDQRIRKLEEKVASLERVVKSICNDRE